MEVGCPGNVRLFRISSRASSAGVPLKRRPSLRLLCASAARGCPGRQEPLQDWAFPELLSNRRSKHSRSTRTDSRGSLEKQRALRADSYRRHKRLFYELRKLTMFRKLSASLMPLILATFGLDLDLPLCRPKSSSEEQRVQNSQVGKRGSGFYDKRPDR